MRPVQARNAIRHPRAYLLLARIGQDNANLTRSATASALAKRPHSLRRRCWHVGFSFCPTRSVTRYETAYQKTLPNRFGNSTLPAHGDSMQRMNEPIVWPPGQRFLSEEEIARGERASRASFRRACEDMAIDADLGPWLRSMYLPLAAWLERARANAGRAIVVGLTGGQGSGKSTFCALLAAVLREGFGARAAVLSVDDLYLTHSERQRLGREVHPLFATRGPPGTHDPALGLETIERLLGQGPGQRTALPSFDKATDDRRPQDAWPVLEGTADYVLFEGWCVGARPQFAAALATPVNALERDEDPESRWREGVNAALAGPYRTLFDRIDIQIMLRIDGMERVFEWRRLQEKKLRERVKREGTGDVPSRVMSDAELDRFIAHYERITRHLLEEMPGRADLVFDIDDRHQPAAVRINRPL